MTASDGPEMVTVTLRATDIADFLRYRMDLPGVVARHVVVEELAEAYYEACPHARPTSNARRGRPSRVYTGWRDR